MRRPINGKQESGALAQLRQVAVQVAAERVAYLQIQAHASDWKWQTAQSEAQKSKGVLITHGPGGRRAPIAANTSK